MPQEMNNSSLHWRCKNGDETSFIFKLYLRLGTAQPSPPSVIIMYSASVNSDCISHWCIGDPLRVRRVALDNRFIAQG